MRKLHFNSGTFKAMLVQDGAHGMSEAVPG
jgi:hypothetical protein